MKCIITVIDGEKLVHLEGAASDVSLCGTDGAGDTDLHDVPPEWTEEPKRITCPINKLHTEPDGAELSDGFQYPAASFKPAKQG